MTKKISLIVIGLILIAVAVFFVWRPAEGDVYNGDESGIILFYGKGCPHCKNVDQYLKQNNVKEKIQFQKLEVFFNEGNASLLVQFAGRCGLDTETIGVPFLWNGASSTCASGDAGVINFFKAKIGG